MSNEIFYRKFDSSALCINVSMAVWREIDTTFSSLISRHSFKNSDDKKDLTKGEILFRLRRNCHDGYKAVGFANIITELNTIYEAYVLYGLKEKRIKAIKRESQYSVNIWCGNGRQVEKCKNVKCVWFWRWEEGLCQPKIKVGYSPMLL